MTTKILPEGLGHFPNIGVQGEHPGKLFVQISVIHLSAQIGSLPLLRSARMVFLTEKLPGAASTIPYPQPSPVTEGTAGRSWVSVP